MNVQELIAIARASGGLVLDAKGYTTDELSQIARAASGHARVRIYVLNAQTKPVDDLLSIARAGAGAVMFQVS